jgi:hypothetical protein
MAEIILIDIAILVEFSARWIPGLPLVGGFYISAQVCTLVFNQLCAFRPDPALACFQGPAGSTSPPDRIIVVLPSIALGSRLEAPAK